MREDNDASPGFSKLERTREQTPSFPSPRANTRSPRVDSPNSKQLGNTEKAKSIKRISVLDWRNYSLCREDEGEPKRRKKASDKNDEFVSENERQSPASPSHRIAPLRPSCNSVNTMDTGAPLSDEGTESDGPPLHLGAGDMDCRGRKEKKQEEKGSRTDSSLETPYSDVHLKQPMHVYPSTDFPSPDFNKTDDRFKKLNIQRDEIVASDDELEMKEEEVSSDSQSFNTSGGCCDDAEEMIVEVVEKSEKGEEEEPLMEKEEETVEVVSRKRDPIFPPHSEHYIDSHCHLDFIYLKKEFDRMDDLMRWYGGAFPRTFHGCVTNFINPEVLFHYPGWIDTVVKHDKVVGTTWGCHPHNSVITDEKMEQLKKHIISKRETLKIVAIGECGVDRKNNSIALDQQMKVFRFQVKLAIELNLPLVIHCREGVDDPEDHVLAVLKEYPNHPIHRHCFTRDVQVAKKWMAALTNVTFGFTPMVINNRHMEEVLRFVPLDRIHLETDAPYFAPAQFRDCKIHFSLPSAAVYVAAEVARAKGLPLDEVIRVTRLCTNRIYRLPIKA